MANIIQNRMGILLHVDLQLILVLIINPIAYLFFFVSKNFSIKKIVHANKIKVANCALAAIYGISRYIAPIVTKNDITSFLQVFY